MSKSGSLLDKLGVKKTIKTTSKGGSKTLENSLCLENIFLWQDYWKVFYPFLLRYTKM